MKPKEIDPCWIYLSLARFGVRKLKSVGPAVGSGSQSTIGDRQSRTVGPPYRPEVAVMEGWPGNKRVGLALGRTASGASRHGAWKLVGHLPESSHASLVKRDSQVAPNPKALVCWFVFGCLMGRWVSKADCDV